MPGENSVPHHRRLTLVSNAWPETTRYGPGRIPNHRCCRIFRLSHRLRLVAGAVVIFSRDEEQTSRAAQILRALAAAAVHSRIGARGKLRRHCIGRNGWLWFTG